MKLSPYEKKIFRFFFGISEIYIKFGIPSTKRWASEVIYIWYYRLQEVGLLKCPKSRLSEHLWTVNMLKGPKHCINLHCSIFVNFFDHSEKISAGKALFKEYLKHWDCLLA